MRDLRPILCNHRCNGAEVVASFETGGIFTVEYETFAGERRTIANLRKIDASIRVSELRKRGYRNVKRLEQSLI